MSPVSKNTTATSGTLVNPKPYFTSGLSYSDFGRSSKGKRLLAEEVNNSAFIDKLELEHLRSLQQIRSLEARLEEMQDLLLAKMKALDSYQETNVSLQNELKFLKEMLDEEEQNMEHMQIQQSSGILSLPTVTSSCLVDSQTTFQNIVPEAPKPCLPDVDASLPPINKVSPPKSSASDRSTRTLANTEDKQLADQSSTGIQQADSLPVLDTNALGQGPDYFKSLFSDFKKEASDHRFLEQREISSSAEQVYNAATSSATGNIKIAEVHMDGYFVRLFNCSLDKEEDIGGYLLQQNVRGYPVSSYRFPPKIRVKANTAIMVWAAEANVTHNSPTDLVWKELSKFRTGPDYTTILCKPSGQAVAWYTPVRWSKPSAYQKCDTEEEAQNNSQHTVMMEKDHIGKVHEQSGPGKMQSKPSTPMLETTHRHQMEGATPVLIKREKGPPKILPPISSPWTQSTAFPTHPDYAISRTSAMGNDGSSQCRQSRAQTAIPDRPSGSLSTGSRRCKNSDAFVGRTSRGPTRSAGGRRGNLKLLLPGSFLPLYDQHKEALHILHSVQNLSFQPPMPHPNDLHHGQFKRSDVLRLHRALGFRSTEVLRKFILQYQAAEPGVPDSKPLL